MTAPPRPRAGRVKAIAIAVSLLAVCLMLAGGAPSPTSRSAAFLIAGMSKIPSPPKGSSWAPAPIDANGLRMVASTDGQRFEVHTKAGDRTFLPGVDLGSTTPGFEPGEFSISAAQYRAWFAAMSWLGFRAVRIYTLHPPAFYQQLAAFDRANPDRPLYLMQGVRPPDGISDTAAFQKELRDASAAVSGDLTRAAAPGRPGGTWDTDVSPWLLGWIIGQEISTYGGTSPAVAGHYFRTSDDATSAERWLGARMDELAGYEAKRGLSQPIAFLNTTTTDPLKHPGEGDRLRLDANHVRPTAAWPAGTFASYHAFPYAPNLPGDDRSDPYAGYLATLHRYHSGMPTLITEFGVPSAVGSGHADPLGRSEGDHSEQDAMKTDADLLRLIEDKGMGGGFLYEWSDEWFRSTANTAAHQVPDRRPLWHDPLTAGQWFGLLATDASGPPGATPTELLDSGGGWPARRVTARLDETYLNLDVTLGGTQPDALALGFDVLPGLTGTPFAGGTDRKSDVILALNLVSHTGQTYVRDQLDPLPLDAAVPDGQRGPAPTGWKPLELLLSPPTKSSQPAKGNTATKSNTATNGSTATNGGAATNGKGQNGTPAELQNAGLLRYGSWNPDDPDADDRSLWHLDGDDVMLRVPWAMLGFADPSSRLVLVPRPAAGGRATRATQVSPGIALTAAASGSVQDAGQINWAGWNRAYYAERIKQGAASVRDAALELAP